MITYLVYLPSGARRDSPDVVFLADRFAWLAFVFPAFWLVFQRQWTAGIVVFILQGLLMTGSALPGAALAAILMELALRLLVALEGPSFLANRLEAKGHTLAAIVPAPDLATAEAMYGAMLETAGAETTPLLHRMPAGSASNTAVDPSNPGFGLFDTYGSR
jgi:hypothetical protein